MLVQRTQAGLISVDPVSRVIGYVNNVLSKSSFIALRMGILYSYTGFGIQIMA